MVATNNEVAIQLATKGEFLLKWAFGPDWSQIQRRDRLSPWLPAFAFFSFFYGSGVRFRLWAYKRGLFKRERLPGFALSIGNLTVGGTGKTPAACMLAEWALKEGYRTAILSRGYGGHYKGSVLEVSDGNDIKVGPAQAGDEPYLLAKRLKGVSVIVCRKRYSAGIYAHERFGSNLFVLDDGFQHWDLHRDLDLVLMDASNPFGNGHLLPWGPLREPKGALERADAFLITRSGDDPSPKILVDELKSEWPGKPVFRSDHAPERIVFPAKGVVETCDSVSGKRVVAFAGIGKPEGFVKTLTELGAEVVSFKRFEDHHPFQPREIQGLMDDLRRLQADYLLTTEKDWARMEDTVPRYPDLAYLTIRMDVLDEKEAFFRMVKEKVGR